jgi:ribosomal protein S18 acetylase RimI-like enzyme
MEIKIRKFEDRDFSAAAEFMNKLQDYLIPLDPLHRLVRNEGYGEAYAKSLLDKIAKNRGVIYLAEAGDKPVGLAAGIIEDASPEDAWGSIPSKSGRIIELIVDEKQRGQNIGKELMVEIEKYLIDNGCDVIRVEVFEPNKTAHDFYKKLGYNDRVIDLIKKVV